jgi:hypothetical protein
MAAGQAPVSVSCMQQCAGNVILYIQSNHQPAPAAVSCYGEWVRTADNGTLVNRPHLVVLLQSLLDISRGLCHLCDCIVSLWPHLNAVHHCLYCTTCYQVNNIQWLMLPSSCSWHSLLLALCLRSLS